jgi:hypothetical protein
MTSFALLLSGTPPALCSSVPQTGDSSGKQNALQIDARQIGSRPGD